MVKRSHIIILIFSLPFLLFNSCKKYEEGPGISLRKKSVRLEGIYSVRKIFVDGSDSTLVFAGDYVSWSPLSSRKLYTIVILHGEKNQFELRAYSPMYEKVIFGELNADKKFKTLTTIGDNYYNWLFNNTLEITRLTYGEFWYKTNVDGKEYEIRLAEI